MSSEYIIQVLVLSALSGAATILGVIIGIRVNHKSGIVFGASFAAGIMILISLCELMPASFREGMHWVTVAGVAAGAAVLWVASAVLPHFHTAQEIESAGPKRLMTMAYLLAIGLILHDFPEGFAIPSSFHFSDSLGFIVVIATFIHNIPEGYILSVAGSVNGRRNMSYYSAFFSALSTLAGAIFGLLLLDRFHALNQFFLAVAAGAMLFIACHELIPYVKHIGRGKKMSFLGFGASSAVYLLLLLIF
ncbi:MAG: ZIP family metal transporter [Patescibacteria group bacterium]